MSTDEYGKLYVAGWKCCFIVPYEGQIQVYGIGSHYVRNQKPILLMLVMGLLELDDNVKRRNFYNLTMCIFSGMKMTKEPERKLFLKLDEIYS